jgi:glutamate--cysteine ligase
MSLIKTKSEFEDFICSNWNKVNQWIDHAQGQLSQPLTSSVDVRESRLKYAPVDHNMYPAGFNNLCSRDLLKCSDIFKETLLKKNPQIKKIGLLPESHTKNKFYLEHLAKLKSTLEMGDFEVVIFSPDTQLFTEGEHFIDLESIHGKKILIEAAELCDGAFHSRSRGESFHFDVILLNNDQSSPLDLDWRSLKTMIFPTPFAGWFKRQKIHHFKKYKEIADLFCQEFEISPELIQAKFSAVENVDFDAKDGLDQIAAEVDHLLGELPPESSVFVKASQGTYGMGISVVSSGNEIRSMNRKIRNKMDVGKNNLKFTSVLIQEGVETILKYDDAPAEVTIYLVDGKSAGGFMRSNPLKGTQANLNAQGMVYQKLCLSDIKQDCDHTIKEAVYSVIARLSVLAASYEMKELMELT